MYKRQELFHLNQGLYEDIDPAKYETSYTNPAYACKRFGAETCLYLSALYAELHSNIPNAIEERLFNLTTIFELFIEIYNLFEDSDCKPEQIRSALYYYFFDYRDVTITAGLNDMLNPETVSYTHLDVYKRQKTYRPLVFRLP